MPYVGGIITFWIYLIWFIRLSVAGFAGKDRIQHLQLLLAAIVLLALQSQAICEGVDEAS
jgi:hypothetical protein